MEELVQAACDRGAPRAASSPVYPLETRASADWTGATPIKISGWGPLCGIVASPGALQTLIYPLSNTEWAGGEDVVAEVVAGGEAAG
jgi:hypothetical protein